MMGPQVPSGIAPKFQHLPYEPCRRCGCSGWNPDDPDRLCPKCCGDRYVLNLPWTRTKGRAPIALKLTPAEVRTLRNLDCPLPEYPTDGTPEWAAFDTAEKQAKAERIRLMRERLHAKWGPGGPPKRLARRVGK